MLGKLEQHQEHEKEPAKQRVVVKDKRKEVLPITYMIISAMEYY